MSSGINARRMKQRRAAERCLNQWTVLNNTQVASWRCTPPPCPKSALIRDPRRQHDPLRDCNGRWGAGLHSRIAILCPPLAAMRRTTCASPISAASYSPADTVDGADLGCDIVGQAH